MRSLRSLIAAGRATIRRFRADPVDRDVFRLMRQVLRPDSSCIDVGSHAGAVLREMLRIAPHGRHIAVEPLSWFAARLRSEFPGVRVVEAALAALPGETTFQYVETNPAYSGILRRQYERPDETVREISVPAFRLDDLVEPGHSIHFVKVDVEGGELGVFEGARGMLARERPVVVFEHGLGAADYYETAPADIHALLAGDLEMLVYSLAGFLDGDAPLSLTAMEREFITCGGYMYVAVPRERHGLSSR